MVVQPPTSSAIAELITRHGWSAADDSVPATYVNPPPTQPTAVQMSTDHASDDVAYTGFLSETEVGRVPGVIWDHHRRR